MTAYRRLSAAATITCTLAATTCTAAPPRPASDLQMTVLHARSRALIEAAEPNFFHLEDVKVRAYDTLAYTALHGCGSPSMAEGMVGLLDPTAFGKSIDKAARLFVLPPLVRYIRLYPQCLSTTQVARIRALLALPQPLFTHGTLNHALMSATSFYLLAEMFPDQQWREGQGHPVPGATVLTRYRHLLMGRFAATLQHGHNEQLSPTYAVADLFPLLNLIDFARDRNLARAAEVVVVAAIAMLRANSVDGFVLSPVGRETSDAPQLQTYPHTTANDLLWLYYGPGARPPHAPYAPAYMAMFATSSWRPPAALLALQQPSDEPYTIQTRTPGFSEWAANGTPSLFGSTLIATDVAIGSGEFAPYPGDTGSTDTAFTILPRRKRGATAITCSAVVGDQASALQQAVRVGRSGTLLYDVGAIPGCRFGTDADETLQSPDALVLRYGSTAIGLRFLSGSARYTIAAPPGIAEARLNGSRPAIVYRVAQLTNGESLTRFRAELLAAPMDYTAVSGTIRFQSDEGQSVTASFSAPTPLGGGHWASLAAVTIGGRSPSTPPAGYISSPILTVGGGRFSLRSSGGTLHGTVVGASASLSE